MSSLLTLSHLLLHETLANQSYHAEEVTAVYFSWYPIIRTLTDVNKCLRLLPVHIRVGEETNVVGIFDTDIGSGIRVPIQPESQATLVDNSPAYRVLAPELTWSANLKIIPTPKRHVATTWAYSGST